jgi:hypothetical protein
MRVADDNISQTTHSVEALVGVPGSPFTARSALEFRLAMGTATITVATRENPYAGLLDLASLTSLLRMSLEYHSKQGTNGAILADWVRSCAEVESNAWALANQVLSDEQQAELRKSIQDFYAKNLHHDAKNLDRRDTLMLQPLRLASALPRAVQMQQGSGGILDLSGIDPFAGLDPAVREVTETRLFAERAMYVLQRAPWMLRGQVELLLMDATHQPDVAETLTNLTSLTESVDRASKAAESISRTAEALPGKVSAEREALVAALKDQEEGLTTLMRAATALSDSLSGTVTNTDALMKRFGVGEPKPPEEHVEPKTNTRPFNILEYAETAEKATALARQLDSVISNLNATLDSKVLNQLSDQATSDARRVLNHAFLLAASLTVLVLVCALVYRRIVPRRHP